MSKSLEIWKRETVNHSRKTRVSYEHGLKLFLEGVGWTADQLYEERLNDERSEDPRDKRRIEGLVALQMKRMVEAGKKAETSKLVAKAVKSFLDAQGLTFSLKPSQKPRGATNGSRICSPEQIRVMWDNASRVEFRKRNRAILMVLKDSGLRIGDVAHMKVGDYQNSRVLKNVDGEEFRVFKPYETEKMRVLAYPILGPEAVQAVNDYLEERQAGRKVERENRMEDILPEVLREDSPLFLKRGGEPLVSNNIAQLFVTWSKYLGKEGVKVSAHSLRKYHTAYLEVGRVPKNWIAKLQGKKIADSTEAYSHPEDLGDVLVKAYIKAYDGLRVFKDATAIRNVRELEAKVASLSRLVHEFETRARDRGQESAVLSMLLEDPEVKAKLFEKLAREGLGKVTEKAMETVKSDRELIKKHVDSEETQK